jgi:hypothetical protein
MFRNKNPEVEAMKLRSGKQSRYKCFMTELFANDIDRSPCAAKGIL